MGALVRARQAQEELAQYQLASAERRARDAHDARRRANAKVDELSQLSGDDARLTGPAFAAAAAALQSAAATSAMAAFVAQQADLGTSQRLDQLRHAAINRDVAEHLQDNATAAERAFELQAAQRELDESAGTRHRARTEARGMTAPAGLAEVTAQIAALQAQLDTLSAPSVTDPSSASNFASALAGATPSATTAAAATAPTSATPVSAFAVPGATTTTPTAAPAAATTSTGGPTGADVVADAKKYLGIPYVWGGESTSGLDCSGLVQKTFGDLGVSLPRVAADQAHSGTPVASLADAQPGDLLFFGNPAYHVAIYAGNNQLIESPEPGKTVHITDVYQTPTSIRRIVPDGGTAAVGAVAAPGTGLTSAQLTAARGVPGRRRLREPVRRGRADLRAAQRSARGRRPAGVRRQPERGQPGRRAGLDAADAEHRRRAGRQRLRPEPGDPGRRADLQGQPRAVPRLGAARARRLQRRRRRGEPVRRDPALRRDPELRPQDHGDAGGRRMTVPTTTVATAAAALPVQPAASGTPGTPAPTADFSALLAALTGAAGSHQPAVTTGPPASPEQCPAAQPGLPTEQGRKPQPALPVLPADEAYPADAADAADPVDPAPHPAKHVGTDDAASLPGQDAALALAAQDAAVAAAPALVGALQARLAPPPPPVRTEVNSSSPAAAPVDAAGATSGTTPSTTTPSTTAPSTAAPSSAAPKSTAPDPTTTAAPAAPAGPPKTAPPAHPSAATRHGAPAQSAAPGAHTDAAPHAHTPPADTAPQVDPTQPQDQQTQQQPQVGGVAPAAAPAAPAPVSAPDRTPAVVHPQPQLTDAIAQLRTRGNGTHQLDVALHPAELGAVRVRAALHGDTLTITVSCADDAARQAVTAALPDLHHALGGMGGTATIDLDLRDAGRGHSQSDDTQPAARDQRDPADPNPDDRPRQRSRQSADGLDRWM